MPGYETQKEHEEQLTSPAMLQVATQTIFYGQPEIEIQSQLIPMVAEYLCGSTFPVKHGYTTCTNAMCCLLRRVFVFFFYNGLGVPFWITQLLHKTKRAWRESQKKVCIFTLSNLNNRLEYRVNCRRLEEKFSRFIQKMSAKVLHKLIQFNNNVF